MSGYPYDTGSSFVRHPGGYAHDAFGHTAADDAGIRPACFRKIPHTGLDVSPKKTGDTSARVVSPIPGTIVKAGTDPEAGNHHIIKHDLYAEWWIGGHHSAFVKRAGHVDRGDDIAKMGASGGAAGVHVHWTVATSLEAALAYVGGWVQYRNGRSVAAWARQAVRGQDQRLYGLIDPWPLIEREWADEVRLIAEADATATRREDDMRKIHAPNRGQALVGPGYYFPIPPAFSATLDTVWGPGIELSDRGFDEARAGATQGRLADAFLSLEGALDAAASVSGADDDPTVFADAIVERVLVALGGDAAKTVADRIIERVDSGAK